MEDAELAHKVSGDEDGYPEDFTGITRATSNDDPALTEAHVVGGTAFFFSRPEFEQTLDWLFVDEARQVGLANMVAMGRAARNIVLVGDPRQLPQVIQGRIPTPQTSPVSTGCWTIMRRFHPSEASSCLSRGGCIRTFAVSFPIRSMRDG